MNKKKNCCANRRRGVRCVVSIEEGEDEPMDESCCHMVAVGDEGSGRAQE